MARTCAFASTQYLTFATAPVSTTPMTMACWVNLTDLLQYYDVIGVVGGTGNWHLIYTVGTTGICDADSNNNTVEASGNSTLGIVAGVWTHVCAVFTSATSRTIYVSGGNSATNATSVTAPVLTSMWLGGPRASGNTINGAIAFPAFWNIALTAADALELSQGISPRKKHPEALVSYARLSGGTSPEPDTVNVGSWTLVAGPTVSVNPRLYCP